MKKSGFLFSGMAIVATFLLCLAMSCSNDILEVESEKPIDSGISFSKQTKEDITKKELSNILLKISNDNQLINDLHAYVKESLGYGLDEIAFVDEITKVSHFFIFCL